MGRTVTNPAPAGDLIDGAVSAVTRAASGGHEGGGSLVAYCRDIPKIKIRGLAAPVRKRQRVQVRNQGTQGILPDFACLTEDQALDGGEFLRLLQGFQKLDNGFFPFAHHAKIHGRVLPEQLIFKDGDMDAAENDGDGTVWFSVRPQW